MTTSGTFTVTAVGGATIAGSITVTGATATLEPIGILAPNTQYVATVSTSATDTAGSPLPAAFTWNFTTVGPPDAPAIGTASAGNAQATVTFTFAPPASDGGATITGYTVTANPGPATATSVGPVPPPLGVVVPGLLNNGTPYTFTVTATNIAGESVPSAPSNSVTPNNIGAIPPPTPAITSVTLGNAQATVAFTTPACVPPGCPTITSFTVTAFIGGVATAITASGGASPIVVSGLSNGITYTFRVAAFNSVGTSPTSGASANATPAGLPGAPTAAVVSAGNAQATVSFTPPASNGGSAITAYTVTSNPGGIIATGAASPIVVPALINGTPYTFTVTAANSIGTGPPSAPSNSATPTPGVTIPGAPTAASAVGGNAQATVAFTPPASNGGSAIVSYTVTSSPGGITASGGASPIVVPGLTNGTAFTFTVTATNSAGTGAASAASNSATPATVPGAPTAASAVAGSAQATVSFTPPASNGGSAITSYTATSNPSGITATGGASPLVVTGLTNGIAYTFTVIASNNVGSSGPSASTNSATPAATTAPGAPTAASAVAGDALATVSFTPPASNGGSAITGYTVTSNPPGGVDSNAGSTGLSHVVTGLVNGTAYVFTVRAANSIGTGPASGVSNPVVPATVPGAPGTVVATAGDEQATVSFTPPASNGAAITSYTVTSTPGGITAFGSASPIVVTGLNNTQGFAFRVAATNSVGTGPNSALSNSVNPSPADTVPSAPLGVTATATNGAATVTFNTPASNGGSAILRYRVTSNPPGGVDQAVGLGLSHFVNGLTNGVAYTFRVTAENNVGTSPASGASNSVIPVTAPGAPTAVNATAGNAQATVSFTPPANNGGAAISTYTVICTPACPPAKTGAASPIVITGLVNGTSYTFRVRATNPGVAGAGLPQTGPLSAVSNSVTPNPTATVPGSPTGANATAGNTQATVTFSAGSTGGSPITGFTVTSNPPGGVDSDAGETGLSHVVTGLVNGTAYTFTVRATNSVGTGPASGASNTVTPVTAPGAPTGVTAIAGNQLATVSFTPPASNGGAAIISYRVDALIGGVATGVFVTGSASPIVVNALTNGTAYTFRVRATNSVSLTGPNSAQSNAVTPSSATVPGAPTGVSASAGNAQATVTFSAAAANGSPVTGYTVTSSPGGGVDTNAGSTGLSHVVTGLTNGVAYTFTVTATNAIGTSNASAPSNSATPAGVPGAPTAVSAVAGNQQATVSFTPPASNGGAAITSYRVTCTPACPLPVPTGSASPIVATGLTNGTAYTFTVRATNIVGQGPASLASNSVIPTASATACSPTTPVVAGAISLRAQAMRVTGVAPLGVFFDATATTSSATTRPFHDIEYRWNFGDISGPGSSVWTTGSRPGVSSRNLATGPLTAHMFDPAPVDYVAGSVTRTVTLTAFDGTSTATCTMQVVVTDPNHVSSPFAGTNTLCVDNGALPVAGADGCPVGAVVANNANFTTVINTTAGNGSTRKRILLRRGKTFTSTGGAFITSSGPGLLGAYGATGNRPVITGTGSKIVLGASGNPGFGDWRVVDLDLDGVSRGGGSTGFVPGGTSRQITIWNNIVRNLDLGVNLNLTTLDAINTSSTVAPIWNQWLVGNNQFATNHEYAFIGALNRSALLGNLVTGQEVQHAMRLIHAQKVVVSNNELTGTGNGTALTVRGIGWEVANRQSGNQFTLPPNTHSEETIVSDNKLTGGPAATTFTHSAALGTEGPRFRNHIAERNWIINSSNTAMSTEVSLGTIRNNLFDLDLSPGAFRPISVQRSGLAANPDADSVFIYNNSAYTDSGAAPPFVFVDINGAVTPGASLVIRNNLGYAPNNPNAQSVPVRDNLPPPGVAETASNNSTTAQIRTVNPLFDTYKPTQPSHWQPQTGSYAINGGFAAPPVPVFSDFFVAPRTGNHMGAVNP